MVFLIILQDLVMAFFVTLQDLIVFLFAISQRLNMAFSQYYLGASCFFTRLPGPTMVCFHNLTKVHYSIAMVQHSLLREILTRLTKVHHEPFHNTPRIMIAFFTIYSKGPSCVCFTIYSRIEMLRFDCILCCASTAFSQAEMLRFDYVLEEGNAAI